jgi:hypothetical protein
MPVYGRSTVAPHVRTIAPITDIRYPISDFSGLLSDRANANDIDDYYSQRAASAVTGCVVPRKIPSRIRRAFSPACSSSTVR